MFVPLPLLIVAGLVGLVLLFFAFRPRGRSNDLMAPPRSMPAPRPVGAPVPPGSVPGLPPEVEAQIWDLLRADQVIMAIKLAREATGLGLKEAKDLVDGMRQSGLPER